MGSEKVLTVGGRSFIYIKLKVKALELTLEELHDLSFPSLNKISTCF
jgi:hypothetical protein